jgi:SNF2 family DNA or RNA helicase
VEKHKVLVQKIKLKSPSSKIDMAKSFIKDHAGQPVVVFSSSKQTCYLAKEEFAKAHITSEVLSGDTPQRDRNGMVKRFNNGDFQVFIGVIEAAAEGIDGLQENCDTMIFLDRSWRTIKNKQAEERLDRPGQKNSTRVIDIMGKDTRDAGRKQTIELKWEKIKEMLGDPK